jgi:hypothetical protein
LGSRLGRRAALRIEEKRSDIFAKGVIAIR